MLTLWSARVVAGVGSLALSLTAGAVIASAEPDLGPIVNTTCSYRQVMGALNAESPQAAAQFNASPAAQAWLRSFLAAPPAKRQQMAQQVQSMPALQQYTGVITQVANTCNNY
jgi:hemophore-related protein